MMMGYSSAALTVMGMLKVPDMIIALGQLMCGAGSASLEEEGWEGMMEL